MAATGCCVTVRTLCATTDFFLRRPARPAGSRSPSASCRAIARAREFADGLPAGHSPGRHPRSWRRPRWRGFEASLPLPHHAGLDVQLARDLRQGLFALQQLLDDTTLELHGEDASAVRLPWKLADEALPSCRSRIAPSLSSSIGERIRFSERRRSSVDHRPLDNLVSLHTVRPSHARIGVGACNLPRCQGDNPPQSTATGWRRPRGIGPSAVGMTTRKGHEVMQRRVAILGRNRRSWRGSPCTTM
jgi:hypothetical protein